MKRLMTVWFVILGVLASWGGAWGQTRKDYERLARETLGSIGLADEDLSSYTDNGGPLILFRLRSGALLMLSRDLGHTVTYSSDPASADAVRSADQPPTVSVQEAKRRALALVPEDEPDPWQVTEAKYAGPGNAGISGRVTVRVSKRYHGRIPKRGDHVHLVLNARTGAVIHYRRVRGVTMMPPPERTISEEQARAMALAAVEKIADERLREAALRSWRSQRPSARLGLIDASIAPSTRSARLMWSFTGGGLLVTVDAETGALNRVDRDISAGIADRSVPLSSVPEVASVPFDGKDKVDPETRAECERVARDLLREIGAPQVPVTSFRNELEDKIVMLSFEDGSRVSMSREPLGAVVSYSKGRVRGNEGRSSEEPTTMTVEQARSRALALVPQAELDQWEVTEAKHHDPGAGEMSGKISVRIHKRYYGRSTQLGDSLGIDFNARTGEVVWFIRGAGKKATPPPAQVVPEEEARATALAAVEQLAGDWSREAALRVWRSEPPRGSLAYAPPGRTRPDAHPTVRSWPRDLRLMWHFGGGGVLVTVDAETGLLNTVDEFKGAAGPRDGRSEMPTTASAAEDLAAEKTTTAQSTETRASPWLWGLLVLPAAALAWAIVKTKGARR